MSAHHEHAYAFVTSIGLAITGRFSSVLLVTMHIHLPPVISEMAQLFCYMGGGMAGFISAYLFYEKRVKPFLKAKMK